MSLLLQYQPNDVKRHDEAVFDLRLRRDRAMQEVPDFTVLKRHAAAIKAHTLDHLADYLEMFEAKAHAAGAKVHWAADAKEHNEIVLNLLQHHGVRRMVKSKSMLTEECQLNPFLESHGVEVTDTDLGERIVQLGNEPPSHIVVPAIHRRRDEIGELFHRHMNTPAGETDPARLTEYARQDLRSRFLDAQAGLTGVNFAIAETGTIVVCTNEGNADLGMSLPPLHIASMGIDKIIPTVDDLAIFLRLLARSATGQHITAYTSMVTGPLRSGELHIVIVDGGRTRLLEDPSKRRALGCIRCGACLNTCPVYRRAGGHAYGEPVPGPIGSVLAPILGSGPVAASLPQASTLCGSCTSVCPVGIDLHKLLLEWRHGTAKPDPDLRYGLRIAAWLMARPALYRRVMKVVCRGHPLISKRWPGNPASRWLDARELPEFPPMSYYEKRRSENR